MAEKKKPEQRAVILIGPSHGAKAGERCVVDASVAASLVRRRLAKYAPSSATAKAPE